METINTRRFFRLCEQLDRYPDKYRPRLARACEKGRIADFRETYRKHFNEVISGVCSIETVTQRSTFKLMSDGSYVHTDDRSGDCGFVASHVLEQMDNGAWTYHRRLTETGGGNDRAGILCAVARLDTDPFKTKPGFLPTQLGCERITQGPVR
jgi:hypothetical protein